VALRVFFAYFAVKFLTMLLNFLWRQIKSNCLMLEMPLMRAIAKWFVLRHAAAANRNYRAALQAVFVALHIHDLKIAVYFYRPVVIYGKSCFAHDLFFGEDNDTMAMPGKI
jgi:hypothetical protein